MILTAQSYPYVPGCPGSFMAWVSIRRLLDAKTYITCDSHVVPHRSTEQAQGCLTSEFGWDPVLSPWYERMMRTEGGARTRGYLRRFKRADRFRSGALDPGLKTFLSDKRRLGRPEILLLDPVWGRRAGHWLKFSTSNHVASVFTSRAHILPPVQGCLARR